MSAQTINVGGIVAELGTKKIGFMKVADRVDGAINIPIVILNGVSPGPRLWVIGGVHGDEYVGPVAIGRITRKIDPQKLKGTVVAIPVANPPAWEARTYRTPIDDVNLFSAYPGDSAGSVTQRIANAIFTELQSKADYVVDLHSDFTLQMAGPCVLFGGEGEKGKAAEDLAKSFGYEVLVRYKIPGTLLEEATSRGIPAVTTETGGEGRVQEDDVALYVNGVSNVILTVTK